MRVLLTLLMIISLTSYSIASEASGVELPLQYQFIASDNVNKNIDNKLVLAKENNTRLLLVLGAQWCHDSKSLATKFSSDEMQAVLENNYELLFVDVGYLEKGFDVAKRFGMPIYYGTPTVMIIDPNSEQLLNADSMLQWMSADSIELSHYQVYFSEMASKKINNPLENSARLAQYYHQIEKVALEQATRIKKAYAAFGPVLKNYKENNVQFSDESGDRWQQVQKLRYKLQKDILALKEQAQKAVLEDEPLILIFPSYPTFDWE